MLVIGVVGELNIGVQYGIWRQLKARDPVWGLLVLIALQIEDYRHWPALRGLSSPPSTNAREPWPFNGTKVPLEAFTGSKKSCHRNQTCDFGAKHTVEYDSVLSQQSISGEIISLILWVWKPGFFKSGYIYLFCALCIFNHVTVRITISHTTGSCTVVQCTHVYRYAQ